MPDGFLTDADDRSHRPMAAVPERSISVNVRGAAAPLVSCLMGTYLHEQYIERALDTLLDQDYPEDSLEIIVVDDGSPDRTREVVARHTGRVRYIWKENAGLLDTVNVLLAAATGKYIAFFSGDDETPRSSVRRRVELLERRPEVGLCYGDMEVIDARGRVTAPSFFASSGLAPLRGKVLGDLLADNFITGGATMVRASLVDRFYPMTGDIAWEDWWTALRVAEVAEVDYLTDGPVSRYRSHGGNMVHRIRGAEFVEARRKEFIFRRHFMRTLDTTSVSIAQLAVAVRAFRANLDFVTKRGGLAAADVYVVSDAERARAHELAARAQEELVHSPESSFRAALIAVIEDPDSPAAAAALRAASAALNIRGPSLWAGAVRRAVGVRRRVGARWLARGAR